ncbi:hypothetical protein BASA81_012414 [Batrachochytrium salamandrivorans]|nr:hypothetical protein BASA81_012414 [Batrachochytrium salamandrivorans]
MREILLLLLLLLGLVSGARPDKKDIAKSARWLVSSCDFGVIATMHSEPASVLRKVGKPFTNVASYSDGVKSDKIRANGLGVPFFYLTELDETAKDAKTNNQVAFTVTEKSSNADGNCKDLSAQDPRCSRVTFVGKLVKTKHVEQAKLALFSKHPSMASYPEGHGFAFYELEIESITFLNNFGGASPLSVSDYLAAVVSSESVVIPAALTL